MERRTFLQGAAASIAAAPFASALAQGRRALPRVQPTIIWNDNADYLNQHNFDPLKAEPDDLVRYGLPRLDTSPQLYDVWQRIFAQPLLYQKPPGVRPPFVDILTNPPGALPLVTTRYETSLNWSGAYIEPNNGNMFTEVAGIWTIPAIAKSGGPDVDEDYVCSIWVGLDGQRRYFNSSLPQIGTRQEIERTTGVPRYSAWYQWWMRGQKANPVNRIPIKVTSDDKVLCDVQAQSLTEVIVSMARFGPPWPIEFWSASTSPPVSRITGKMPQISGATAEWVVERPTSLKNPPNLQPLPNFCEVEFTNCFVQAQAPSQVAPPYDAPSISQNLNGARFIQMYERLDNPARTRMLAKPSRFTPDRQDAFRVAYIGP